MRYTRGHNLLSHSVENIDAVLEGWYLTGQVRTFDTIGNRCSEEKSEGDCECSEEHLRFIDE